MTTILDTIALTAARLARPPSRVAERARFESIARHELAVVARVRAESCSACRFHDGVHRVPCLYHTPSSKRVARAQAIGVVR